MNPLNNLQQKALTINKGVAIDACQIQSINHSINKEKGEVEKQKLPKEILIKKEISVNSLGILNPTELAQSEKDRNKLSSKSHSSFSTHRFENSIRLLTGNPSEQIEQILIELRSICIRFRNN